MYNNKDPELKHCKIPCIKNQIDKFRLQGFQFQIHDPSSDKMHEQFKRLGMLKNPPETLYMNSGPVNAGQTDDTI